MKTLLYVLTRDPRFLDAETLDRIGIEFRFPAWVVLFLAVAAVAFAIYAYRRTRGIDGRRRKVLTVLRAAAYVAMLIMLAGPRLRVEGEGNPSGPLPVVVDRTESMGIEDAQEKPRLTGALALRTALQENARSQPALGQVHYLYGDGVVPYDDAVRAAATNAAAAGPQALAPLGSHTSLREMINGGLKEHRGAYCPGMLLVTDGANNVPDLLETTIDDLNRRRVPLYFAALGQENPKDISLEHIIGDDIVFVNEKTKYFLAMTQNGFQGRPLKINAQFGSKPVTVPDFTPDRDGDSSVPFEFTPEEEGTFDLVVKAPPDPEESTDQNNQVSRRVRVIKDKIRILMVFGGPSWEYRFLNGAFERDRRVAFKCYLQNADRRLFKYSQDRLLEKLPATPREFMGSWDIVILSRIDAGNLHAAFQKMLYDFVSEDGGGLVILSDGADIPFSLKGTKLEALLPVRLKAAAGASSFSQEMFKPLDTPYTFAVTDDGQGNPLTTFDPNPAQNRKIWKEFPPTFEMCTEVELKPSAIPLVDAYVTAEGPRYPAIAYQSYGKGTVVYMGFDSSWRWRKEFGDRYFRDYWGKVVQFLGLPHLLGESAQARILIDRTTASVGERVVITAAVRNRDYSPFLAESVMLKIQTEGAKEKDYPVAAVAGRPGIFRATYYPDAEGRVTLRLPPEFSSEPIEFTVVKVSREFQDSGVKLALMADLARKTGGEVFSQGISGPRAGNAPAVSNAVPPDAGSRSGRDIQRARAEREAALAETAKRLTTQHKRLLEDSGFVRSLAQHILATIAEKRVRTQLLIEKDLWDYAGLMILAATLLCIEYAFRKLWYLD